MVGSRMVVGVFVALVAVVVGLGSAEDAQAAAKKAKKPFVSFKAGKKFKSNVQTTASFQRSTATLAIQAHAFKAGLRGGSDRRLNFSAAGVDIESVTFPHTFTAGTAFYSNKSWRGLLPNGTPSNWQDDTLSVTLTGLAGTRLTGTFEGTLAPQNTVEPAVISKGKFAVDVGIFD